MEIIRAYQQLMTYNKKYSYMQSDGKIVFNQNWAWNTTIQALNKRNYSIVKITYKSIVIILITADI